MSDRTRRPVTLKGRGTRVVLIAPGGDPAKFEHGDDQRLGSTLDRIAALGWEVTAVIEPSHHLDALRMVLDGVADLVVVTRSQDFPLVMLAVDLSPGSGRRIQRLPRPAEDHPWRDGQRQRRPQPVERDDDPETRRADTDLAPGIAQEPARSDVPGRDVRTRLVDRSAQRPNPEAVDGPETHEAPTDSNTEITNAGAKSGTAVPNPGRRPRTSDLRRAWLFGQTASGGRRRRRA